MNDDMILVDGTDFERDMDRRNACLDEGYYEGRVKALREAIEIVCKSFTKEEADVALQQRLAADRKLLHKYKRQRA
jgi:hypothetical protein